MSNDNTEMQRSLDRVVELLEDIKTNITLTRTERRQKPVDTDKYYTSSDIANLMNVTMSTVYRWCRMGLVCNVKVGGRLLFPKEDIAKLLEKRERLGKDWFEEIPVK